MDLVVISPPFALCITPARLIIGGQGKRGLLSMAASTRLSFSIVDSYFWVVVYSDVTMTSFAFPWCWSTI